MLRRTQTNYNSRKLQVAIVGGGPSGCYVAHHLLKKYGDQLHVDVYERLPVPYGLSRYGVAPDHPEVKNVEKTFTDMFEGRDGYNNSSKATFIGNVCIGRDVTIPQLRERYHAVVVATGAGGDLKLNLPGEGSLSGVLSARQFVDYYNTVPDPIADPKNCPVSLDQVEDVLLIGNGNVAMDVARVLAMPHQFWGSTDMNDHACKSLAKSTVKTVTVVARRGVEHSAFTTKEFRELTKADRDLAVRVDDFDLQALIGPKGSVDPKDRARRRQLELIHKYTPAAAVPQEEAVQKSLGIKGGGGNSNLGDRKEGGGPPPPTTISDFQLNPVSPRKISFRYNLTPKEFIPHESSSSTADRVGGVVFSSTTRSDELTTIKSQLVLRSIGYKSDSIPGVPFDPARCVIPNTQGRVLGEPGLYCSGWVKRGPKGVILQTMMDAQETASSIWADLEKVRQAAAAAVSSGGGVEFQSSSSATTAASVEDPTTNALKTGNHSVVEHLRGRHILPVSMDGVKEIWKQEKAHGVELGKPAEKISSCHTMLDIVVASAESS